MTERIKHYCHAEVVGQMNDAPEMRLVGANGTPLATARIGVKCSMKVKGEWKSSWLNYNLKAWDEMAAKLAAIPGGSVIKVKGDVKSEEWVGRTGEIRTSFVLTIEDVEWLGETQPKKGAPRSSGAPDNGSAFGGEVDFGSADNLPW